MEILLLGIYSFFVWLIFFKFKLLPWNMVSQVIVVTLPIIGLTATILILNAVAPSSHDVRVINYVVPINSPVRGMVTEVPIEPNRPIKKGEVLFKIDPTPFEIACKSYEAQLAQLQVQLLTAEASSRNLPEQLKGATGQRESLNSKLQLSRLRLAQFKELAESGAGNKFDYEEAQSDVLGLEGEMASLTAAESQAREKLATKTSTGDQDDVASVKAGIAKAEAQLAEAKWELSQTTYLAPANGTVVALTLRPGAMA
ncbi:MAG: HlyD family secretion protein, partial [Burkholderiales bacterium]|nr:HlyD family secretion protein [Opitutaceae bacterium]